MSLEGYNSKILILWGSGEHSRGKNQTTSRETRKKDSVTDQVPLTPKQYSKHSKIQWTEKTSHDFK